MSLRLAPKSVTLNDLEQHNDHIFCVISPNSADFEAHYVKVFEDTPFFLRRKCSPKNLV